MQMNLPASMRRLAEKWSIRHRFALQMSNLHVQEHSGTRRGKRILIGSLHGRTLVRTANTNIHDVVKKGANECFRLRERPLAIFTALDLLGARSAEVVDGDRLRNAFEK